MDRFANKYRDLVEIGSGGFATVYRATNTLGRPVAIKLLHQHLAQNAESRQRFMREAQAAAQLEHPNIVRIMDVDEWQGDVFIVMEFLPGQSLKDKLKGGNPLALGEVAAIVAQLAAALDFAHSTGVVHRDIKPSNVIISPTGHATLTDFGLASVRGAETLTQSGIVGTPDYMAPEQAEARPGWKPTGAVDVYALGVLTFQMLAGRLPFAGETPLAIIQAHIHETAPLLSTIVAEVAPEVDRAVAKALAKKPERRPATGAELARVLTVSAERGSKEVEQQGQLAALYAEAQEHMNGKRWIEAMAALAQILRLDPAYRDATALLAQTTAGAAKEQERFAHWKELQGIYEKGLALLGERKFDEAIAELGELVRRDADFPQAAAKLADAQAAKEAWLAERTARLETMYQDLSAGVLADLRKACDLWTEEAAFVDRDDVLAALGVRKSSGAETPLLQERARLVPLALKVTPPQATPARAVAAPPAAAPRAAARKTVDILVPEMITIPEGEFIMGSDRHRDYEKPLHRLHLPSYAVAKYPVINREYAAFVRAGREAPRGWTDSMYPDGEDNYPVIYVSWHDAVAYCAWLAEMTGQPFRLPTEAEWEKAARGTDGRDWPWGNEFGTDMCNTNEARRGRTSPVSEYPLGASPYGCLDMAGNVWEWTNTCYGYAYPYQADAREARESSERRVLRGGAWNYVGYDARTSARDWYLPDYIGAAVGFRCAMDLPR